MHNSKEKNFDGRLEHFSTCIDTCNVFGIGLLGSITCFAAGALPEDMVDFETWHSWFFRTLAVSTIVIGLSWLILQSKRSQIQREIDGRDNQIDDTLEPRELPGWHRYYVHLAACTSFLFAVGYLLVFGLWSDVFKWTNDYEIRLYAFVSAGIVGFVVLCIGDYRYFEEQNALFNEHRKSKLKPSQSDSARSNFTCAEVFKICERQSKRTNFVGVALLAQIAAVTANALESAPPFYDAAFFSSVLVSALFLGLVRLPHIQAARRVKNAIDEGELTRNDIANFEEVRKLEKYRPRILYCCLISPPLFLVLGIFQEILPMIETLAHLLSFALGVVLIIWILERLNESDYSEQESGTG